MEASQEDSDMEQDGACQGAGESGSRVGWRLGLADVNYPIESGETASLLCGIGHAIQYPGINPTGKEKEKREVRLPWCPRG